MSKKVLHITGALSSSLVGEFNNIRASGLGYMVFDIVTELSSQCDLQVDVINYKDSYKSCTIGKCHFIGMTYGKALLHFRFHNTGLFIKLLCKYHKSINFVKNLTYSYAVAGFIFDTIKKVHYDIVHFHGCTPMTVLVRNYCMTHKIPFVITLHGINCMGGVNLDFYNKLFEKDMIMLWLKEKQKVSFVSTGSRLRILEYLGQGEASNFCTIPNFTNMNNSGNNKTIDIRNYYDIPEDGFIILYIGNIEKRKNQLTFVKSIHALSKESVDKIFVLFVGRDGVGEESIKEAIQEGMNSDHMRLCGCIPKDMIPCYLSQGNATALISYSEGFGLGIIEGFRFGLPSLAIYDMDGIPDFYNEDAMVLLQNRDIQTVSDGIKQLKCKKWDKEKIILYSMNFSGSEIAKKYKEFYDNTIKGNA